MAAEACLFEHVLCKDLRLPALPGLATSARRIASHSGDRATRGSNVRWKKIGGRMLTGQNERSPSWHGMHRAVLFAVCRKVRVEKF